MGQLTDSHVRDIVRSEVHTLSNDIRRDIAKLESRLQDMHALQSDVQRTLHDIEQVMGQTKNIASVSSVLSQLQLSIDDIRARVKQAEESNRYTAGYVAMRLKERYEKHY